MIRTGYLLFALALALFAVVSNYGAALAVSFALGFVYFQIATTMSTELQHNLREGRTRLGDATVVHGLRWKYSDWQSDLRTPHGCPRSKMDTPDRCDRCSHQRQMVRPVSTPSNRIPRRIRAWNHADGSITTALTVRCRGVLELFVQVPQSGSP